jgi:surfeit locus 1 family protein
MAAVVVGLAILVALGTWQLHRRSIKQTLIARIETRMTSEPVDWPVALDALRRGKDVDFLRVRISGRYRSGPQFHLFSQLQGQSGWQLVAVLESDGGPAVLVDRGFVPDELKDAAALRVTGGQVTITGILRLHQMARGLFTPDNDAAANQWFWWDISAMAAAAGLASGDVPEAIVHREPQTADPMWPKAMGADLAGIPNNHLQYAMTWYALAIVLAVMAFIFARTRLQAPDRHNNHRDA